MKKKKKLKFETFTKPENVCLFIEENKVSREDVLSVTESSKEMESTHTKISVFTLFYWDIEN